MYEQWMMKIQRTTFDETIYVFVFNTFFYNGYQ